MLSTVVHDRSARRWMVFVQTFCALGLGSALLAPGVAAAATADGDVDGRRGTYGQLTFTGAPGEANRVRITVDDLGRVLSLTCAIRWSRSVVASGSMRIPPVASRETTLRGRCWATAMTGP